MKIVLYGRGYQAKNLIEVANKNYAILAVTDSFVEKTEKEDCFLGIKVISIQDICKYEYDYVIICTLKENELIKERLTIGGVSDDRIMGLKDFYIMLYQECYQNSELWDFYINHDHRSMNKMLHYFNVYEQWLEKFRNREVVMVEIGVAEGGSLQMWKNYFGPQATIVGIDINPKCKELEEEQIHVEIGSQEDVQFWTDIKNKYPKIDILLDDGGHTMTQQIVTFEEMFSHIQNGGIYICEDLHTSYWENYGGGLKKSDTYIEYSKNFIDDINAYHISGKESNYNTQNMAGVHYYDSMIVIEKDKRISRPFSATHNTIQ